jgi:hypothetical protein
MSDIERDPDSNRDPAHPTPQELIETAESEGVAATEAETDPRYRLEDDGPAAPPPAD